jgi:mannose-1-phosphate guanylyltransferase
MNNVTKAMIMAAGVGSRLDPLTKELPKPLVPITNKPVMDILLENLSSIGITKVIANTYYHADKIIDRYSNNNFGIDFSYITEQDLSGTAGGLKKCQYFFDKGETFVVLSGDGLTNADIQKGIKLHQNSNAIATIGIKK